MEFTQANIKLIEKTIKDLMSTNYDIKDQSTWPVMRAAKIFGINQAQIAVMRNPEEFGVSSDELSKILPQLSSDIYTLNDLQEALQDIKNS